MATIAKILNNNDYITILTSYGVIFQNKSMKTNKQTK